MPIGNVTKVTIQIADANGNKLKRTVYSTDESPALELAKAIEANVCEGIEGAWTAPKTATNAGQVVTMDEGGEFEVTEGGESEDAEA